MKKYFIMAILCGILLISGCAYQGPAGNSQNPPAGVNQTGAPSGNNAATSGGGSGSQSGGAQAAPDSVSIQNFAFNPATITVARGATITWTNNDPTAHTVTGNGFESGTLGPGDVYKHTFNDAGTFSYGCSIHPNMQGTVIVK